MNLLRQVEEKLKIKNSVYAKDGITLDKIFFEAIKNSNPQYEEVLQEYNTDTELFSDLIKEKVKTEKENYETRLELSHNHLNSHIQQRVESSYLEKTEKVINDYIRLINENKIDQNDEEKCFKYFIYTLYQIEIDEDGQEYCSYLQQSGFDFDRFLDDVEKGDGNNGSVLEELCDNLNKKAENGDIDPVIGRKEETLKVMEILGKRKKANPLLIGPAGCGKTSIPEGLALLITEGKVPHTMVNAEIYTLQVANMVAGTSFRGQFEEKLMKLLSEIEQMKKDGKQPILFIDEIHSIVGSGNNNGLDFGNIIKPALANGSLCCIGATTDGEFQKFINQEKALKRRFVPVKVDEPSIEETIAILDGIKKYYEKKHNVRYTKEAIERCVEISTKYITNTARPDKCIDLMDYTGSVCNIEKTAKVTNEEIEKGLSKYVNIPLKVLQKDKEKEDAKNKVELTPKIKEHIFGQDSAIEDVVEILELNMAGFKEKDKTMGNFLLVGPTGVGKTELAKSLSKELELPLERIDMSEFMEAHSVSKFIGAPPGYVGFDQAGKLSKIVEKNPHCILLLDEIEKAHPKVLDILLQVMDNAKVTDSQGEELNFENVLLLMTSNSGARTLKTKSIGMTEDTTVQKSKSDKEMNSFFSPEFRNRLDKIVRFKSLGKDHAKNILNKFLKEVELSDGAVSNNVKITLDDKAIDLLLDEGYSDENGARPLKNVIKRRITKEIAKSCLYGEISKGKNKVSVSVKNNTLNFSYKK